ncbi:MAG: PIN domain-containing protein [Methylacidiphilales bacterium]|nr:PIN domain-containing protein [Candidatus Methylacidiphilales bacterium]
MILVDANLLIYAVDSQSPYHEKSRTWWDLQLSGISPLALSWPTLHAFLRITTNPRLSPAYLSLADALKIIDSWLAQPCVQLLQPTSAHRQIFTSLLIETQATGNLIADAALAALAIEHGCELYSADGDFARFPGLRWRNPLLKHTK